MKSRIFSYPKREVLELHQSQIDIDKIKVE